MLREHAGGKGSVPPKGAAVGDQIGCEQPDRGRPPHVRPAGERAKGLGQKAVPRRSEAGPRPQVSHKRLRSHVRLLLPPGRSNRALRLVSV